MVREIPQKTVAKVLWDIGFRSPGTMKRRASIPQRSAERYIKEFREGGEHTRKKYNLKLCSNRNGPPIHLTWAPIENIWGWLKVQVNKDLPKSVKALENSIKKHWNSINVDFFEPYFDSMLNRMAMLIENDGGKINY